MKSLLRDDRQLKTFTIVFHLISIDLEIKAISGLTGCQLKHFKRSSLFVDQTIIVFNVFLKIGRLLFTHLDEIQLQTPIEPVVDLFF